MRKVFNACTLYLGIRCLYALQGVLYLSGGLISKVLLLLFLLMSIYYTCTTFGKYKFPSLLRGITCLFVLLSCYGVFLLFTNSDFYAAGNPVPKFEYLKSILLSFTPIYACYHFTKQNQLTENNIRVWIVVFIIVATLSYYRVQSEVVFQTGNENITNNMAYSFIALLPAIFFFQKRPLVQYLILGYCMLFILFSMKRGAILIGVFALIYFLYINRKVVQKKYKVLTNFLTIGIFFVGAFVVNSYLITNEYFVSRIDSTMEGDSSNRDQLYTYFLSHFMEEQNPINFLFGHGANGTLSIYIDYAHNDWLELAINQGLLGLLVYAIYWVIFIKSIRQFRENALMKNYLTIFFIIFFVKSFFSMSYQMNIYASAILGYMIGAHGISKGQYLKLS